MIAEENADVKAAVDEFIEQQRMTAAANKQLLLDELRQAL